MPRPGRITPKHKRRTATMAVKAGPRIDQFKGAKKKATTKRGAQLAAQGQRKVDSHLKGKKGAATTRRKAANIISRARKQGPAKR